MDYTNENRRDSLVFQGILESLYNLGLTPKSSGFLYLLDFLFHNTIEDIYADSDSYKAAIQRVADRHKVSARMVEDNITLILNHAWNRTDTDFLHEMFTPTDSQTPERRPWLREMLTVLLLYCESAEDRKDIYAEFFGLCFRHGIELNL